MTTVQLDQKMEALALANSVRSSNAKLRREIAAMSYADGCQKIAGLLANPVGPVASMPVGRLLTSICRVGEKGMTRFLKHAAIFSTTKRVGALTPRQRQALSHALRNRTLVFPCWQP